jgi:hypothetical protein
MSGPLLLGSDTEGVVTLLGLRREALWFERM